MPSCLLHSVLTMSFISQNYRLGNSNASGHIHSLIVMSDVQHSAFASLVALAGVNGVVHFAANSGLSRMSVVRCKSHRSCLHTKPLSLVNVTSHSKIPAPIRAPASSERIVSSGN